VTPVVHGLRRLPQTNSDRVAVHDHLGAEQGAEQVDLDDELDLLGCEVHERSTAAWFFAEGGQE
jgi:hypothetical protein